EIVSYAYNRLLANAHFTILPQLSPSNQSGGAAAIPTDSGAMQELLVTHDVIVAVQSALDALGYDPGPADGQLGPKTRAAVRAFRVDKGLPISEEIDGEMNARLQEALARLQDSGPVPPAWFVDAGACPYSGCMGHREWISQVQTSLYESAGS